MGRLGLRAVRSSLSSGCPPPRFHEALRACATRSPATGTRLVWGVPGRVPSCRRWPGCCPTAVSPAAGRGHPACVGHPRARAFLQAVARVLSHCCESCCRPQRELGSSPQWEGGPRPRSACNHRLRGAVTVLTHARRSENQDLKTSPTALPTLASGCPLSLVTTACAQTRFLVHRCCQGPCGRGCGDRTAQLGWSRLVSLPPAGPVPSALQRSRPAVEVLRWFPWAGLEGLPSARCSLPLDIGRARWRSASRPLGAAAPCSVGNVGSDSALSR
uniref:Uncharacterized protein n=1 Tax=Myotis myotis TaxID=51298 RepID=A0A7J7RCP3_MYOMY|nr:hypothetical protein mMyoMyo1_010826 [Myotis myotis]